MLGASMSSLRATAILKTDIGGSTALFRALSAQDLAAFLAVHREMITRVSAAHDGRIVKPEGDGFWIVFPSVTAAALAAMTMQEELRLTENSKGNDRVAMRIVITLGDVLHEEGALVGDAVVLATRIEAITPLDEIYLSAGAWLAVNKGEVRTALVDSFTFKGFPWAIPVYRIEQTHRTRTIEGQYIVVTDLQGFTTVVENASMPEVEKTLDGLHDLVAGVCREFEGTIRFSQGDSYYVTFPEAPLALAAVDRLARQWRAAGGPCALKLAMHKGALRAFRDFLYTSSSGTERRHRVPLRPFPWVRAEPSPHHRGDRRRLQQAASGRAERGHRGRGSD